MMMEEDPYATPRSDAEVEAPRVQSRIPMRWPLMVLFTLAAVFQMKVGATAVMNGYFAGGELRARYPDPLDVFWLAARYVMPWCLAMGLVSVLEVWCLARRQWSSWIFLAAFAGAVFTVVLSV